MRKCGAGDPKGSPTESGRHLGDVMKRPKRVSP
jgi:hypothetical protein